MYYIHNNSISKSIISNDDSNDDSNEDSNEYSDEDIPKVYETQVQKSIFGENTMMCFLCKYNGWNLNKRKCKECKECMKFYCCKCESKICEFDMWICYVCRTLKYENGWNIEIHKYLSKITKMKIFSFLLCLYRCDIKKCIPKFIKYEINKLIICDFEKPQNIEKRN